jgi:hypothetical protein
VAGFLKIANRFLTVLWDASVKFIRIELFSFKSFGSIAIIALFLAQAVPSFAVLVRKTNYDSSGQVSGYTIYEYNALGLASKSSFYGASGQLTGYLTSEYNASNLLSKTSNYNASGQLIGYSTFEYNASG